MDLNEDGYLDILSGSYSRMDKDMAGLFQVLWGSEEGFGKPQVLNDADEEPLIITPTGSGDDHVTDKICTRPTAVDLNGDGILDLVSGNFSGTFAFFLGEGDGHFAPESQWLLADGKPLRVDSHGDPFFVDWDGDGDLDLISGSALGGVVLFTNNGSVTDPEFGAAVDLVPAGDGHGYGEAAERFGDSHLVGPQSATRVWVDDVDEDGKLDLLIGDSVSLCYPVDGLEENTVRSQLEAWKAKEQEAYASIQPANGQQPDEKAMEQFQATYQKLQEERAKIVRDDMTGFVWLVRQK